MRQHLVKRMLEERELGMDEPQARPERVSRTGASTKCEWLAAYIESMSY